MALAMLDKLRQNLRTRLETFQLHNDLATFLEALIGLIVVFMLAIAAQRLVRALARGLSSAIVKRFHSDKPNLWAEALQKRYVAGRSAHIVTALLLYWLVPYVLEPYSNVLELVRNVIEGYVALVAIIAINSLLAAAGDVFAGETDADKLRVRIATQAAQGIVGAVGGIILLSVLFDISVTVLISSLAGTTAVTMLLFRDSILGFVAGVQLSGNDMLRIGDWIEVPQYGANGTVEDVGLTTVKVQNFDKTITTIPTYALVSQSFKNWRGMKESGARRIKRAVAIDMHSICFLTADEIQQLKTFYLLQSYLEEQLTEIEAYNQTFAPEARQPPNARGLTNLGTFRVYLEMYLESHPSLKDDMLVLVRHLAPSPEGLPIELYCFSKEQDWEEYERIQSDIFDHILAILPMFGLKVWQRSVITAIESKPVDPSTIS